MERIKVTEAARLMGVSAQFVRIGMQLEEFTGIKKPPAATGGSAQ